MTLNLRSAPFLLRDPTLSHTHIAFSYGGNIWIVNHEGGNLRRLTSLGREGKPAFSPDGKYIAFIGEYGGPRGIFVLPVEGGEPRRLTHHPDDLGRVNSILTRPGDAVGWTPDGRQILFSSRRAAFAGDIFPIIQLFTIPLEGGPATPVPLIRAAEGSYSGDAARIAYVPHVPWEPGRKGYRGGQTTLIRIATLADSSIETTIPKDNCNDFNPMWVGDTIYFLSDRNGPVTVFAYDVSSRRVSQLVKNDGLDIKSACALSDTIVYEQFGSLHRLDVQSGEDCALDIRPVADFAEVRPHFKNVAELVAADNTIVNVAPKLSPIGTHVVFELGGRILTLPAENGTTRTLTETSGRVERDPAWSPDGGSIAYFSDESGEYALHIREAGGLGAVRKISLGDPPSFYYVPTWSPDARKIAYTDRRLNYWYVDLQQGTPVRLDTGLQVDPSWVPRDPCCRLPLAWSQDSRWIAYAKILPSRLHGLFAYSIEHAKTYALTDGMSDVLHVAFDKAGEYLYFTASTELGLAADWGAMSHFGRPVRRSVYALLLDKTVPAPLGALADASIGPCVVPRQNRARVEIDLQDIAKRIVRLTITPRNYSALFAGQSGVLFLLEAPVEQPFIGRPQQVHRFELATRKTERILEDITYFDLSFDGDRMLYARTQDKVRQWFISKTQSLVDASAASGPSKLKLDSLEVHVEPRVEWRQLFEQVWRTQRDFLYDPGLHGIDLERIKTTYRPFLENITTRNDLYYLFEEMLGNLDVGHTWAIPFENHGRPRAKVGLLGADYRVEHGRYRFAHIYTGDPWDPAARSPLNEPGSCVEVGEYLLAVNGREVYPRAEVFSYFENTAGKQVVLTVGPRADGGDARQLVVVALENEYPLRYFAWTEGNRHRVDELSGGRVAYVHLPNCVLEGYTAFNRYFFAQAGKEAVIMDVRYNTGGILPDYMLDRLRQTLLGYWHMREGEDAAAPPLSIFGPKIMLINEMAGSIGDLLPWIFRRTGIGPLVGKRTWGGLVGHYAFAQDLPDNGLLSHPNLAFYTPEGEWEIENRGVPPDIEVDEDPHAARQGRDLQLEGAVRLALNRLRESPPPPRPQRPAYPRHRKV